MAACQRICRRQSILKLLRLGYKSNRGRAQALSDGLRLGGHIIPRRVKRMFDERSEPRATLPLDAQLDWRGTSMSITVAKLSRSGAMLLCPHVPHIGEQVTLTLPGEAAIAAVVRWVRDGRIGLHFAASVG